MSEQHINDAILEHLAFLVAQDTQNPPRHIKASDGLFVHLSEYFSTLGFTIELTDLAEGHVIFYAVKGQPTVLFNVHLDTVPVDETTLSQWQKPPLTLTVEDQKAYGRGTCDIKGAAACLMALAEDADDLALVFTTDEEGSNGCCVQSFIDNTDLSAYQQVIVAEPTQMQAVVKHRGFQSVQVNISGASGHSSVPQALQGNAIHRCGQWMKQALDYCQTFVTHDNPAGLCFNIGKIEGGEKSNMIAETLFLHFSMRIPPELSSEGVLKNLQDFQSSQPWQWHIKDFPSLPAQQSESKHSLEFCQQHDLPVGAMVDFWTEAALFSQAGFAAMVLGPGNIQQAHTVDEWVELSQLQQCYHTYQAIINGGKDHEES